MKRKDGSIKRKDFVTLCFGYGEDSRVANAIFLTLEDKGKVSYFIHREKPYFEWQEFPKLGVNLWKGVYWRIWLSDVFGDRLRYLQLIYRDILDYDEIDKEELPF